MKLEQQFRELYDILLKLRSPEGCPWDREQTPASLRAQLLEETYEAIHAVDTGDTDHVREELGDLYLLVTFLAVMYEEDDSFTVSDALESINQKLVRRHPHVFSDADVGSSSDVIEQWDEIKVREEGKRRKDLLLDSVSSALPALERANKLQKKAASVGFDWPTVEGVLEKLDEEIDEVRTELHDHDPQGTAPAVSDRLEEEIGDLLFSAVNVARHIGVDPSIALHKANEKFMERFAGVEKHFRGSGRDLASATLEQMEEIWQKHK